MKNFDDTFLARWIIGEATPDEISAFKNYPEYKEFLRIKATSDNLSFSEFDEMYALNNLKTKLNTTKKTKVISLYTWVSSVAACLLMLVGFLFFYNSKDIYVTEIGSTSTVSLPDNSTMVLNASAEAKVNTKKWDKDRVVFLDGEAFFNVEKGATFTVNTHLGKIQVLGTQFTVNTIDENVFSVKCFEGKVKVFQNSDEYILTQGMALQMANGEKEQWNFKETQPSWITENETKLNAVPLKQVITVLKRQYNVEVNNLKVLNSETLFTGSFTNKNLAEALYAIFGTLGVNYELETENEVRLLY